MRLGSGQPPDRTRHCLAPLDVDHEPAVADRCHLAGCGHQLAALRRLGAHLCQRPAEHVQVVVGEGEPASVEG